MGEVFSARKEAHKSATLQRSVIANGSTQRWIASFKSVQNRTLRYRTSNFETDFAGHLRERAQVRRQYDSDHDNV
jgi:hypothetical protein